MQDCKLPDSTSLPPSWKGLTPPCEGPTPKADPKPRALEGSRAPVFSLSIETLQLPFAPCASEEPCTARGVQICAVDYCASLGCSSKHCFVSGRRCSHQTRTIGRGGRSSASLAEYAVAQLLPKTDLYTTSGVREAHRCYLRKPDQVILYSSRALVGTDGQTVPKLGI